MSAVIGSEVNYRVYEYKHVRYNDQNYSCKLRRVYEKWEYLTLCGWIKYVSSNCICTTTESMYFLWMSDTLLNRISGKENLTQVLLVYSPGWRAQHHTETQLLSVAYVLYCTLNCLCVCINCACMPNFQGFTSCNMYCSFPVWTFLSSGICILLPYERIISVV